MAVVLHHISNQKNFQEWKLISFHLIKSTFGINFKSHSNLDFADSKILTFPSFFKKSFRNWQEYLSSCVIIPSLISSKIIQYDKNPKINSKPIYVEFLQKISFSHMISLIYSIIISSKVNMPTFKVHFEKNFVSIIFNGKTYAHFRVKSL